jgi:hypothetical protein
MGTVAALAPGGSGFGQVMVPPAHAKESEASPKITVKKARFIEDLKEIIAICVNMIGYY